MSGTFLEKEIHFKNNCNLPPNILHCSVLVYRNAVLFSLSFSCILIIKIIINTLCPYRAVQYGAIPKYSAPEVTWYIKNYSLSQE